MNRIDDLAADVENIDVEHGDLWEDFKQPPDIELDEVAVRLAQIALEKVRTRRDARIHDAVGNKDEAKRLYDEAVKLTRLQNCIIAEYGEEVKWRAEWFLERDYERVRAMSNRKYRKRGDKQ